jgi:peptidoglycan/LPS O-acetylase OafA/YrhL
MNQLKPSENSYESRTRRNVIRLFYWTAAWVGTSALMAFGPKFLWNKALLFTLLAVALNVFVGICMIMTNKKYFDELDDLQRKVHLNSLAITVGVAFIAAVPYSVMDSYHVIPFHADIAYLMMLMGLTYGVSNVYGIWRYR